MTNTDYKLSLLAMVAEPLQAIAFSTYAAELSPTVYINALLAYD